MDNPIRRAARGEVCTLQIPFNVCHGDIQTTVLAHIPGKYVDGTGKTAGKVPDLSAVFACDRCHDWLDRRRFQRVWAYNRAPIILKALSRTHARLLEKGVIVVNKNSNEGDLETS